MYPLKLDAPINDYLWGGTRLKTEYGFKTDKEKAAEAWVLSCHKDGESVVLNGEMKGKTLSEVLNIWGNDALGVNATRFPYFPLLIKLIDAKDKLSVQVHPDDDYALKNEGEFGKTEAWYVVDSAEGASLIYGFKKEISKEEFRRRIEDNTLLEVCNIVPVKKGDLFFIPSGTLHAIGEGILIAEVQQNSNTTYRVSDYGRLGADGKPRELHIEKAVDVTETIPPKMPYGKTGEIIKENFGERRLLASCEFFKMETLSLKGKTEIFGEDSFVSLVVLSGEGKLLGGEEIPFKKGDSFFIPAKEKVSIEGTAEILVSRV